MASTEKRETTRGMRYDVRYRDPAGKPRMRTFTTLKASRAFASTTEADLTRGRWIDPKLGTVTLAEYSTRWLHNRPDLRPNTVALYKSLLRLHILPKLGEVELGKLTPDAVRTWHASLLRGHTVGPNTVAKAYRLLRAVLNTAEEDALIVRNPCRIKRAGAEQSDERPVATPGGVLALADAVAPNRRLLILLAGFCGLRLGECLALKAENVDPLHHLLRVEYQLLELPGRGEQVLSPPKSAAGRREVELPPTVEAAVLDHLAAFATPDGWLFTGARGGPLRRSGWNADYKRARASVGLDDRLRFHDLRHSALTLLASGGATTAELMAQAGHSSAAAALRYQHATKARAKHLAGLMELAIGSAGATASSKALDLHGYESA